MCVALGRVEEEIADTGTRDVLLLRCNVCEADAVRNVWRPLLSCLPEGAFSKFRKLEQPQNRFWRGLQDPQPGAKGCWIDLYALGRKLLMRDESPKLEHTLYS